MGRTNSTRTRGNTSGTEGRRRGMNAIIGSIFVGAAFVVSLWVSPLPNPQPDAAPTNTMVPANTVYSPLDASKAATPTTVPQPQIGDCGAWAGYALGFGWPATEAPQLAQIMRLESGCNPYAVGDNGNSYGLLQIHCPTWVARSTHWPTGWAAANGYPITCNDLLDPATNLAIGFLIWAGVPGSGGGWWNWTTYRP
jgi:hypothetical protein